MSYTSALETCSAEVQKGVEWLRNNVDVAKDGAQYAGVLRSGKIRSRVG